MSGFILWALRFALLGPGGMVFARLRIQRGFLPGPRKYVRHSPGKPVVYSYGLLELILGYFGVQWPVVLGYLAFVAPLGSFPGFWPLVLDFC